VHASEGENRREKEREQNESECFEWKDKRWLTHTHLHSLPAVLISCSRPFCLCFAFRNAKRVRACVGWLSAPSSYVCASEKQVLRACVRELPCLFRRRWNEKIERSTGFFVCFHSPKKMRFERSASFCALFIHIMYSKTPSVDMYRSQYKKMRSSLILALLRSRFCLNLPTVPLEFDRQTR